MKVGFERHDMAPVVAVFGFHLTVEQTLAVIKPCLVRHGGVISD
jgi:hypothetical protein